VGQYGSDKKLLPVEVNRRYEPKFIAADVEHVEAVALHIHHVHACERALEFHEVLKVARLNQLRPRSQRRDGGRIFFSELLERLLRDHVHGWKLSHIEIVVKPRDFSP